MSDSGGDYVGGDQNWNDQGWNDPTPAWQGHVPTYYAPPPTPPPVAYPAYQTYQRPPVNYAPAEVGWWQGADGLWYPPETMPAGGYPSYGYGYGSVSPKSRLAAGLLQLFLGSLGVGRFYLGYGGMGAAQLLVTIFTCGLGSIWGLIDGIYILCGGTETDGRGMPLDW